jgi:hypothetical protein
MGCIWVTIICEPYLQSIMKLKRAPVESTRDQKDLPGSMVGARNDSNTVNHGLPVHSVEIDDLALRFLSGDRFTIARRSDVPLLRGESPFFWTFPGIRALCVPNYWKKYIISHQPRVHEDIS